MKAKPRSRPEERSEGRVRPVTGPNCAKKKIQSGGTGVSWQSRHLLKVVPEVLLLVRVLEAAHEQLEIERQVYV